MVETRRRQVPWWKREIVRLRGYTVGTAVVGIMVLRDWLNHVEAGYVLMGLAAVFGVYGVESSRNRTTPRGMVDKAAKKIKDINNEQL